MPAATLISTHGCVTCHNFGAGGGNIGPDLSHGAPNPSKAAIQAQIENGGGGMPPFKDAFTPQEIQQVVDFIDGLRTGTPPSS